MAVSVMAHQELVSEHRGESDHHQQGGDKVDDVASPHGWSSRPSAFQRTTGPVVKIRPMSRGGEDDGALDLGGGAEDHLPNRAPFWRRATKG
jgi:hypothetical protein